MPLSIEEIRARFCELNSEGKAHEEAFLQLDIPLQTLIALLDLKTEVPAFALAAKVTKMEDFVAWIRKAEVTQLFEEHHLHRLKEGTEMRHQLLTQEVDFFHRGARNETLEKFCNSYPRTSSLRDVSFSTLESEFRDTPEWTTICNAWVAAEGSRSPPGTIRAEAQEANLNLYLVEQLENRRIFSAKQLTRQTCAELVQSKLPGSNKLLELYHKKSAENEQLTADKKAKSAELLAKVEQASAKVIELRSEVEKGTISPEDLRKKMDEIADPLSSLNSIPSWRFSDDDIRNKNSAIFDQMQEDFATALLSVPKGPVTMTDAEIIANASAGQAMYGLPLCMNPSFVGQQANRPLITPTSAALLRAPSMAGLQTHESFSSKEASSCFNDSLTRCGRSMCASLKAGGWGFSVEASVSSASSQSSHSVRRECRESSYFSRNEYVFAPMKSFSLGLDDMQLTEEARRDVKNVHSLEGAKCFLETYYSHVSSGVQHLGGIYVQRLDIQTDKTHSMESLSQKASEEFSLSFGASGSGYGFTASVAAKHTSFSDSQQTQGGTHATESVVVTTSLVTHGPQIANQALFTQVLAQSPSTWRIIDRGDLNSMVPVWKLLELDLDPEVQSKAPRVRKAWLIMARLYGWDKLGVSSIDNIIQRAIMEQRASMLGIVAGANLDDAICDEELQRLQNNEEAVQQLDEAIMISNQSLLADLNINPNVLANHVLQISQLILRYNSRLMVNLIPKLIERGALATFVRWIALHEDRSKTEHARQLLFTLFTPNIRNSIRDYAPTSSFFSNEKINSFFRTEEPKQASEGELDEYDPPIVSTLDELIAKVSSVLDDELDMLPMEKSVRVGALLAANLFRDGIPVFAFLRKHLGKQFDMLRSGFHKTLEETELELLRDVLQEVRTKLVQIPSNTSKEAILQQLNEAFMVKSKPEAGGIAGHTQITQVFENRFMVDRRAPLGASGRLDDLLIDLLRHRLSLRRVIPTPANPSSGGWNDGLGEALAEDDDSEEEDEGGTAMQSSVQKQQGILPETTPYDYGQNFMALVLNTLRGMNIIEQEYFLRYLVERHALVPLLIKAPNQQRYESYAHILNLVPLAISESDSTIVPSDHNLMRVVVLSNNPSSSSNVGVIRQLLNCDSLVGFETQSTKLWSGVETVVETGLGFIALPKANQQTDDASNSPGIQKVSLDPGQTLCGENVYQCVQVINILGNPDDVLGHILAADLADVYLVENDGPDVDKARKKFIQQWQDRIPTESLIMVSLTSPEFSKEKRKFIGPHNAKTFVSLKGKLDHRLLSEITPIMLGIGRQNLGKRREVKVHTLHDLVLNLPRDERSQLAENKIHALEGKICSSMEAVDFQTFRPNTLQLQFSFKREAQAERAASDERIRRGHSAVVQTTAAMCRRQEERKRANLAKNPDYYQKNSLLALFIKQIQQETGEDRALASLLFNKNLDKFSRPALGALQARVAHANDQKMKNPTDTLLRENAVRLKQLFTSTACYSEHLWREISLLYTSTIGENSTNDATLGLLPYYAALHFVDGFPLELFDGDASKLNEAWVARVMDEVAGILGKKLGRLARICVLSILGLQSAGKSTLLNYLFGTRFRASMGTTTKGVNIMLIPVQGANYDYLIVMDTEGVRADGKDSSAESIAADNRMAALATWAADATIIMINGETIVDLKDMLAVVADAYQCTQTAELQNGKFMNTKLFFAQRLPKKSASDNVGAALTLKDNLRDGLQESLRSSKKSLEQQAWAKARQDAMEGDSFNAISFDYSDLMVSAKKILPSVDEPELLGCMINLKQTGQSIDNIDGVIVTYNLKRDSVATRQQWLELAAKHAVANAPMPENSQETFIINMSDFDSERDHIIFDMGKDIGDFPLNYPNETFGLRLIDLLARLSGKLTEPKTIAQWKDQVLAISRDLQSTNLTLTAATRAEMNFIEDQEAQCEKMRRQVASCYSERYHELEESFERIKDAEFENVKRKILETSQAQFKQATEDHVTNGFKAHFQAKINSNIQVKNTRDNCLLWFTQKKTDKTAHIYLSMVTRAEQRFRSFLDDQQKLSDRRVNDLIDSRHFFKNIFEKYCDSVREGTSKLIDDATSQGENTKDWDPEECEQNFSSIFDAVMVRAKKEHPSQTTHIEGKILTLYENNIKSNTDHFPRNIDVDFWTDTYAKDEAPSLPVVQKPDNLLERLTGLRSTPKNDHSPIDRSRGIRMKTRTLRSKILNRLQSLKQYDDTFVLDAISDASETTLEEYLSIKDRVHQYIYELLVVKLTLKQKEWESINSIPNQLKGKRDELFEIFDAKRKGMKELELLQLELTRCVKNSIMEDYALDVAGLIIRELESVDSSGRPKHAWAASTSSGALQALLDLDLAEQVETGNDESVKYTLRYASEHYQRIIDREINAVADKILAFHSDETEHPWYHFRDEKIVPNLRAAALQASISESDNPMTSFRATLLQTRIPKVLRTSLSSISSYSSLKAEQKNFPAMVERVLVETILDKEPPYKTVIESARRGIYFAQMSRKVLVEERANMTLQVRCGSTCGMCQLQCTKEIYHGGEHNTFHQPTGLNGWRYTDSDRIYPHSCATIIERQIGFRYNGTDYRWDQWTSIFPGWEMPRTTFPLKLREYILYHKQPLLQNMFPGVLPLPGSEIPTYNHNLSDLKNELRSRAGLV